MCGGIVYRRIFMIETNSSLILMKLEAGSREDAIIKLCDVLEREGYIGSSYCEEVIKREEEYPTGLPSEGVVAAIPHAFSDDCKKTGTAVGILSSPVQFRNIADFDEILDVELVFLLANASGDNEHLDALQELMGCMSRPEMLKAIKCASSADEVCDILAHAEDYPEE